MAMPQKPFNAIIKASKRAQRLRISISPLGEVILTKPSFCSDKQALHFLHSKEEWIVKHLKTYTPPHTISLPTEVLLKACNTKYTVVTSPSGRGITHDNTTIYINGIDANEKKNIWRLQKYIHGMAKDFLIPTVDKIATKMDISYTRCNIRNQKSRWGSCSSKGAISLNQKLLFVDPPLMRYVIIHELAHRIHPNHSHAFWMYVKQWDPQVEEHNAALDFRTLPAWVLV